MLCPHSSHSVTTTVYSKGSSRSHTGCSHIALQAPDLKKGVHTEARHRLFQPLQDQALHSCLVLLEQGHVDQPVLLCVLRIWPLTAVVYGLGWQQAARADAPQLTGYIKCIVCCDYSISPQTHGCVDGRKCLAPAQRLGPPGDLHAPRQHFQLSVIQHAALLRSI